MNNRQIIRDEIRSIFDYANKIGAERVTISDCMGNRQRFELDTHAGFVDAVCEISQQLDNDPSAGSIATFIGADGEEASWVYLTKIVGENGLRFPAQDWHFGPGYDETFTAKLQTELHHRERTWLTRREIREEQLDPNAEQFGVISA